MAYQYYPNWYNNIYAPPVYQPLNVPQTPVQTQQTAPQNTFQWVQGEAGAKAYPVAAGNSVLLMDSESATIYWKSTDQSGRPLPMKTYDLVERVAEQSPPEIHKLDLSSYVKKEDLSGEIAAMVEKEVNRRLSGLSFKPAQEV